MSPPTSTDDREGTVIDGKLRSAEWRRKQLEGQNTGAGSDVPGGDFDSAAAKDFVSSLMIPVSSLDAGTRAQPPVPDASGLDAVLAESSDLDPSSELDDAASESSAPSDELDRWFEEQATSAPCAPAAQKLPRGSASLEIGTVTAGAKGTQRLRVLDWRRVRTRESDEQCHRPSLQQRLRSRLRAMRAWILAGVTLVIVSVGAVAIAAGGSSPHSTRASSTRASISTTLPGLRDASISKAALLAARRSPGVRVQRHRGPSHRTHHAARRRPITHHATSTVASTNSYTAQHTSSAGGSSSLAANTSASTGSGGASSPPASTSSGGGSSPSSGGSQQPRTGPSGPISLIGAGTTPSG
ncbi:MAG: hypothetical protein ABI323_14445 [Solirubrobacteraceae bacterium]